MNRKIQPDLILNVMNGDESEIQPDLILKSEK